MTNFPDLWNQTVTLKVAEFEVPGATGPLHEVVPKAYQLPAADRKDVRIVPKVGRLVLPDGREVAEAGDHDMWMLMASRKELL